MPATDLDLLVQTAREAGKLASSYFGQRYNITDKPDNLGPVTEADLAVNALLEDRLRNARPNYGWLSEESADTGTRMQRETVFVIDPIDGTRSFIEGQDTWAHSMAIVQNGQPVAAVVFLPIKDRMYAAALDQGATLNDTPISSAKTTALENATLLAARPNLAAQHWPGGVPEFKRSYRPSLAYRLSLVAQGRYDGMITLRPSWEWDIAAGSLILQEAGAVATDQTGATLRFNNAVPQVNGVIAATPAIHSALMDRRQ